MQLISDEMVASFEDGPVLSRGCKAVVEAG